MLNKYNYRRNNRPNGKLIRPKVNKLKKIIKSDMIKYDVAISNKII
jgi:hypothetical protein